MIDIRAKAHDKYSIEFKIKFIGAKKEQKSQFAINTWIFIPNSLDINQETYGKQDFLHDVKSNVRLSTPDFTLEELAQPDNGPIKMLRQSIDKLHAVAPEVMLQSNEYKDYEFRTKLFASIFKSSIRNRWNELEQNTPSENQIAFLFADPIKQILTQFRSIYSTIPSTAENPFLLADEFQNHLANIYSIRLLSLVENSPTLTRLILDEEQYKRQQEYLDLDYSGRLPEQNSNVVERHGLLKKYIGNSLYLKCETEKDGKAVEQLWFGIAAGMAMIISTLIALPFQHYWSNYPAFIFVILVIAYMFKDRTKEYMRQIFSNQLKNRYFDNKTTLRLNDRQVGWIKESVDFVSLSKVPQQVLSERQPSAIEIANMEWDERIILYRKRVFVNNPTLHQSEVYSYEGINDIIRIHLQHFTQKMDDPVVDLRNMVSDGSIIALPAQKIYHLHLVLQCQADDIIEYHHFNIRLTRDGIVSVESHS